MRKLFQRGDTIIEVLIALTVISAVLGGAYVTSNRSLKNIRKAQERGEALKITETQVERLRNAVSIIPSPADTQFCAYNDGSPTGSLPFARNSPSPGTPVPPLDTDDFTTYSLECQQTIGGVTYYKAVEPLGVPADRKFAFYVRWERIGGGHDEVRYVYVLPIEGVTAPSPSIPPTCTLSFSPNPVVAGNSTTLSWTTTDATGLSIDHGIGGVAPLAAGFTSFIPPASDTYVATVTGPGGSDTCSRSITVSAVATPPTCTLTFTPASVITGSNTTLSWTTTDATSLSIDRGIGAVAPVGSGSTSFSPPASDTYTGTVTGPGGVRNCSRPVTVTATPPFEYKPDPIGPGPFDAFVDYDCGTIPGWCYGPPLDTANRSKQRDYISSTGQYISSTYVFNYQWTYPASTTFIPRYFHIVMFDRYVSPFDRLAFPQPMEQVYIELTLDNGVKVTLGPTSEVPDGTCAAVYNRYVLPAAVNRPVTSIRLYHVAGPGVWVGASVVLGYMQLAETNAPAAYNSTADALAAFCP